MLNSQVTLFRWKLWTSHPKSEGPGSSWAGPASTAAFTLEFLGSSHPPGIVRLLLVTVREAYDSSCRVRGGRGGTQGWELGTGVGKRVRQMRTQETRGRCSLIVRLNQDAGARVCRAIRCEGPRSSECGCKGSKEGHVGSLPLNLPQTGQGQAEVLLQVTRLP